MDAAALPGGAGEDLGDCGLEPEVGVAGHQQDAGNPALLEVAQEAKPELVVLGGPDVYAQDLALARGDPSDGRKTVRAARWEEEAAPDRRATFQECSAMFAELAHDLAAAPHGAVGLLKGIRTSELLPVDYVQAEKSPIHRLGNLKWDWRLAADVQRLVQIRRQLIEREVVESVRLI